MKFISTELTEIWKREEIKDKQRASDKQILEGDRNTTYFHAQPNHRRRKKRINMLEGPSGMVQDTDGIIKIVVDYYKNLFGFEQKINVDLAPYFWEAGDRVTDAQNAILDADFTEQEIKHAIFGSYAEGAPGPDGLPFPFYQNFWDLIKQDLFNLFSLWNWQRARSLQIDFCPPDPDSKRT